MSKNNLFKICLILIVFLTPLVSSFKNFAPELSKVLVFLFLNSLAAVFWLWQGGRVKWTLIKSLSLVFIAVLAVTSLLGINLQNSFLGEDPYFQGWLIYCELFLFSIFVSSANIKLKIWLKVLLFSSSLISLIAIFQSLQLYLFHQSIPSYAGRVVSTFGQPDFFGGYLLLSAPFFLNPFNILGIMLSFSRAAVLILGLLIFFKLTLYFKIPRKLTILCLISCLLIAIFLSYYFSSGLLYDEVIEPMTRQAVHLDYQPLEKRYYIWQVIFNFILKRPILGYGLDSINQVFPQFTPVGQNIPSFYIIKYLNVDRAHNYSLDLLFFSGILGLTVWLLLWITLYKKSSNPNLQAWLLIYLLWIQFQNQSIAHLIFFWLMVGLIDKA